MPPPTLPPRSAIAPEHRWNAERVFPTAAAWEAEYQRVSGDLPALRKMHGTLTQSPQALFAALEAMFRLTSRAAKLLMYASISSSVDTTDQEALALQGKASALMSRVRAATAFIRPETLLLGHEHIHHWAAQEPRLAVYGHYFDNLFRLQAHIRTAEVEGILGLVAAPFTTARQSTTVLANAEMHFPEAASSHDEVLPVAQSTIETLLASPDRDVRRTAWDHYADTYLAFKQTLAANLIGAIKQDVFYARAPLSIGTGSFALSQQHSSLGVPQRDRHLPAPSANVASLLGLASARAGL